MGTIGYGQTLTVGGVEVQNIVSCDMSVSQELADDTTCDSAGYIENCYANQQVTIDVSCKYAETGGIEDLLDEILTTRGSGLAVVYRPLGAGSGTKDEYTFTARISSASVSASHGETVDVSFTLESTGTVTYAQQS